MRESLFEQLKKKKLSYVREIKKINNLIDSNAYARAYFSEAFKVSPYNIFYENYADAIHGIFRSTSDFDPIGSLDLLIQHTIDCQLELTLDCFLNYLEFYKTLFNYDGSYKQDEDVNQVKSTIENDCDKLDYRFIFDKSTKTYRVMLNDLEAEALALRVKQTIRDKIYEYLMIRYGDVEKKRMGIKALADDVELICQKYKNIPEYNKLKQFIQCTRHTKDNPKKEFPFYYEQEEKWLDKTFEMIIGILSFTKTKEIVDEIVCLEQN